MYVAGTMSTAPAGRPASTSTPPLDAPLVEPLVAPVLEPLLVVPLPDPDAEPLPTVPEVEVPLDEPVVTTDEPLAVVPLPTDEPVAFPLPPAPLTELPELDPVVLVPVLVPELLCGEPVVPVLEQATSDRTASGISFEAFISSSGGCADDERKAADAHRVLAHRAMGG
jgi:hypothetical protein